MSGNVRQVDMVYDWSTVASRMRRVHKDEAAKLVKGLQDQIPGRFTARDAADTVFLGYQLEQIDKTIYKQEFGNLEAYQYLPLENNLMPWIDSLKWSFWETTGEAYVGPLSNSTTKVGLRQKPYSINFQTVSIGYQYGVDELYKAATAQLPLDTMYPEEARSVFDEAMNRLLLFGSTEWGLGGFFNNANAQTYTVPAVGTGSSKLWSTKTAAQIMDDLVGQINTISANTLQKMKATDVALPVLRYQLIEHLAFNAYTKETVLQVFKERTGCRVWPSNWLLTAGSGSTARMVAWQADAKVASAAVSLPMTNLGLQRKGTVYEDILVGRCGGCLSRKPYGIVYGDGI